jgi:membrane fusion protein (multidrug efflux system)
MDVLFAVPSAELSAMREMEAKGRAKSYGQGSQAYLRLQDGTEYEMPGKVIFLDTQVDSATSAVRAKARFSNPKGLLLPGQFAAVRVGGASLIKAIMLPQAAIMQTESGPAVYVLDAEGRAMRRPVQLGSAFGAEFLVEGGLEEGQAVIVQGQDKVKPGQKVTAEFKAGVDATAGKALEAPGSSRIPEKKGSVEDAPAPVFPDPERERTPQKEERHD